VRAPETKDAAGLLAAEPDGSFEGYASLFDTRDMTGDVVLRGAFAATLGRRGPGGIKMLFQHDPAEPIGRWLAIAEDRVGLKVAGRIHTETARGREVLSLMRARILDGLSIGFRTVRSRAEPKGGTRRLVEVDLWEISVVTFPMLPGARIGAVKEAGPAVDRRLAGRIRRATTLIKAR